MNFKYLIAVPAMMIAAPAMAQEAPAFTGGHAEAIVGYDNVDFGPGIGSGDGVVYGLNLGYDFALGGAVAGIEAELSDSSADKTLAPGVKIEAKRDIYVGARIGAPMGAALLYAKAGYTNARIGADGIGSANGDGFRLGAGVEYALSGNLFLKGEYRYSNYEADVSRHQVVGGLGIRF
jgi:outer membrane immunogenic protein